MDPIFMANDMGGMVYVRKNELIIKFSNRTRYTFRINTKELWEIISTWKDTDWENEKVLIEPIYFDISTWKTFVLIRIKNPVDDNEQATVFQNDFLKALRAVEYVPN